MWYFNAIDTSAGKLSLPSVERLPVTNQSYQMDDLVYIFIQNRDMTQFIIISASYLTPSSHENIVD